MEPKEIYDAAVKAAELALVEACLVYPQDGGLCGGAYTLVRPARGAFVKWLKSQGMGDNGVYGGWEVNCPVDVRTQNADIHEAVERAFAKVLKDNGIKAYVKAYLT